MTHWLCITNEENWQVIRKRNIWGVAERHRNTIARVKPGDRCLIYVKQERKKDTVVEPRIVAAYEVASEVFRDASRIFRAPPGMGHESFPWRIKLKPLKIFSTPLSFKPLIPELRFITNKKRWSGHLMGKAMREIPEEDFELIMNRAP